MPERMRRDVRPAGNNMGLREIATNGGTVRRRSLYRRRVLVHTPVLSR